MKNRIGFDESLERFVYYVTTEHGEHIASTALFLRDPGGRLTCVVDPDLIPTAVRKTSSEKVAALLAPYVDSDGFAICTAEELFDESLASSTVGIALKVSIGEHTVSVRLLDRRVMGGAWLQNQSELSAPPRLVFASLKGGVGRSTALCVLAAELAASGLRVLAVDMDVEAPGIGSMLLTEQTMPKYGLLDYLVESSLENIDEDFYSDLISPSWLTAGRGVISVLPAIGTSSINHPQNILSKIARAYLNGKNDEAVGITFKMQQLLNKITAQNEYDIIFLDARAGLHETTGSALLGLGGRIALFGTDQKQTAAGFDILLSNLAMVRNEGWQDRLLVVHSKASASISNQKIFREKIQESFEGIFLQKSESSSLDAKPSPNLAAMDGVFAVEWEDNQNTIDRRTHDLISEENRSVEVTVILESEGYRDFDPLGNPNCLNPSIYKTVYGDFIYKAKSLLNLPPGPTDERF